MEEWVDQIRENDLKNVLKTISPMKAAELDSIPPYWWKKVRSLLPAILKIVIKEIREDTNQNWLYERRTLKMNVEKDLSHASTRFTKY